MRDPYGRGVMAEGASGLDQTIARASVQSADGLKREYSPAGSKRVREAAVEVLGQEQHPGLGSTAASVDRRVSRPSSAELQLSGPEASHGLEGGQGTSVVTEGAASEDKSEQTGDGALRRTEQGADSGDISLADTAQQPLEPAAPQPQHAAGERSAQPTSPAEHTAAAEPTAGVTAVAAAAAPAAGGLPAAPLPQQQPQHQQQRPTMASRFCPPHGAKAICGRRARMEDAYTAVPFLLEVPMPGGGLCLEELVPPRIATQVKSASGSDGSQDGSDNESDTPSASAPSSSSAGGGVGGGGVSGGAALHAHSPPAMDALHFFGVFDGHGGAEAALHCARTLHERIAEALATRTPPSGDSFNSSSTGFTAGAAAAAMAATAADKAVAEAGSTAAENGPPKLPPTAKPGKPEGVDETSSGGFDFMDTDLLDAHLDSVEAKGETCDVSHFDTAFTSAFLKTDEEFGKVDNAALVGTTAVVALIGDRQLYVGNCGDSRAVLCRSGVAIPLTDDHKAAREDETARVEAAGGQILFWNGVRVMGVLAVSRAIGDHCLRPFVIAQPEVTILGRHDQDELLLLASDGLWDVLSNQEACSLAKRCLRRARQRGASRHSAARIAATVLTRAAVDRGSRDNVTVVVVDLSREELDEEPEEVEESEEGGEGRGRRPATAAAPASSGEGDSSAHGGRVGRSPSKDHSGHRRHRSQPAVIAGPHNEDSRDSGVSGGAARSAEAEARRSRSRQEAASQRPPADA